MVREQLHNQFLKVNARKALDICAAMLAISCSALGGIVDSDGFEWFDGTMPRLASSQYFILRYEHPGGVYNDKGREGLTRWLFTEVRQLADGVSVVEDGVLTNEPRGYPAVNWAKWLHRHSRKVRVKFVGADYKLADDGNGLAPAGFTRLFNGADLNGWKGTTTDEWFNYYNYRAKMSEEEKAELQAKADKQMAAHWHVRDGVLFFDGLPGGSSLATTKEYADFDFVCDWRLLRVYGDSGFYIRSLPQVQIWDPDTWGGIGSGGLYNNVEGLSSPTSREDRPIGTWNRMRIRIKGELVWVWLNGVEVVSGVRMENSIERGKPMPTCERIELQCHGDPIEFRNIFISELP